MSALLKDHSKTPIKSPTDCKLLKSWNALQESFLVAGDKARILDAINNALSEVNAEVEKLRTELRQITQQRLNRPALE
jgi:uncharacterized coiled-coil protein SlyX